MARLTAPLMSLAASGTLGKAITFSVWKGIPYARVRVIPSNPNSVKQQEVRGVFSTLSEMWKRMPIEARLPFDHAVRGQPLTARNKHIQVNAAVLKDQVNCDNLVMSVAGGSAIVPINVAAVDATNGRISITCDAPAAPPGYTISYMSGVCTLDGDPSPVITLPTYTGDDSAAPYAWQIQCGGDYLYQVGVFAVWMRNSDNKAFCSAAVRSQVTVSGS